MNKEKIDAFWNAMPDSLTLDECANGVTIDFEFEGKKYSVNTKVLERPRTHPIEHYYETLERVVSNAEPMA